MHGLQDVYMAKLGLKNSKVGAWTVAGIISVATVLAVAAGYAVHRLRMRNVMQNEIRDIMCAPISALCCNALRCHNLYACCICTSLPLMPRPRLRS